ncbi:MAG: phosphoadenylyl-sulfate reductase [Ilumatobacter sp.]|jgi:phosphoadenosine phosphosulfate reductase|uniref:phosphoadenylyl-sulfate reductase n=1 Tax=Ilumatobacter sp. TaxID=1967498 RepID=UPI001DAEE6D6|nr:phosphoadenylyl-sulfate reductase [Ilumatobacter sp.]MBT5278011.1 phosphoadenylyl-sulfate reductase [Ilumatobacter sp.]MBT5554691.1 phosphoadenylyl-sulfate reductase [Ilumatobacter sp.]MBT5866291.1 phosphoadenylyl-sulfate reductase [Ilumatobacter sp.]MDG0974865.1 phosphoadenylyl-sulfate reductase [Ilumatobacter sp.]
MSRLIDTAPIESSDPRTDASAVLCWAAKTFASGLCVTASFGDATLAHVAHSAVPGITITLLDTGYLFAETEWFADHLVERFAMSVRIIRPRVDIERDVWTTSTDACCADRKVEPLQRALLGATAWATGVRRSDSESRASTKLVHHDLMRSVIKVNPLAGWTDDDVQSYAADHGLPEHPLVDCGYGSIGCWPCTRPAADRTGRWAGSDKTECGLHL